MREQVWARGMSRRSFLRSGNAALTALLGALMSACGRGRGTRGDRRATQQPTALAQEAQTATAPPPAVISPTETLPAPTKPAPPDVAADTVLINGKIITVDAQDAIAQAVAIKDGIIQAVGSDETVQALAGTATQVIDLGGRAVTPGLIDPHNHLQVYGLMDGYYVPFMPPEVKSLEDLRAKLRDVAGQTPTGEWIKGYYFKVSERLPNRHDLDAVSPNHPVFLLQQGGHYGSANTMALRVAGLDASVPDPVGGVIERDARGEPTGVFYNHRAMDMLRKVIPPPDPGMLHDNLAAAQPVFAAVGVTTFHDNNVRGVETVHTYLDVGRDGGMLIKGRTYYTLEWPGDLKRALDEIQRDGGDGHMRFAGFKFLLDGQALMAYCHEPHNGVRWDTPTWDSGIFKQAVRELHDTGLQICVHCVGDAAVDLTLDAYEEAMNANPRPDPRHRLEHAIFTKPEATQRIKDLGVVVSTQPQFARLYQSRARCVDLFGEERTNRFIVTREWLDSGVHLALGSDAPTTVWISPQVTIFGAVRRITYSNDVLGPEQALTVAEALRAHTMGGAYSGFEEDIKGSIELGKQADLAVWSGDPLTAPLADLWKIRIDMTLVDGDVVHQAAA